MVKHSKSVKGTSWSKTLSKNKTFNCVWFYLFSVSLTYWLTEKSNGALYNPLKLEKIQA